MVQPNKITPFNVKEHIPDAYLNDYSYKQLIAFTSALQVSRTMVNIQNKQLEPRDYDTRDIFFKKTFQFEEIPDLYDFAEVHYKPFKSHDKGMYFQMLREKCQIMKYQFWRKQIKSPPITNEKFSTRQIITEIRNNNLFETQASFVIFTGGMSYFLKLYNNPIKFTIVFAISSLTLGYYFSLFRNSNKIFNEIPELPDHEAEQERQKILNYCYTLDIELVSKYMLYEENLKKRLNELK